jgi:subtilase family serine protease
MNPATEGGRPARRAARAALIVLALLACGPVAVAQAAPTPVQRRVVLLGLRAQAGLAAFARQVSRPSSSRYRQFATLPQLRRRFGARPADRRRVLRYLRRRSGVTKVELSSTKTVVLAAMTATAARQTFCARGPGPPERGLCVPRPLRRIVRQISAGERYELGNPSSGSSASARPRTAAQGTPRGCPDAVATGGFTPNQLATAFGVDPLHARGLDGSGIRVDTLAAQIPRGIGLSTWARCFGMRRPPVHAVAMPSGVPTTSDPSTEEALDIEGLASLAPGLERITPIFVPLDQGFAHSFALFMFGALDPARHGGQLPDVLSISDGVCEREFSPDQLRLGQRMLREAAALGITALAAAGDLGFLGCDSGGPGANFPGTSRFVTDVGGTQLTLDAGNRLSSQVVWSTYATDGKDGVGTGGGPSGAFGRPHFQQGPGIGPGLQTGKPTRLGPDLASMASFTPGLATFDGGQGGWGTDGGTSAATPLTAAIVALVGQQERQAGRPALGSLPPLLYRIARGPAYGAAFSDVTVGTSARKPDSPVGRTPRGGAAQPGYDLATGLGSLNGAGFAAAVAGLP